MYSTIQTVTLGTLTRSEPSIARIFNYSLNFQEFFLCTIWVFNAYLYILYAWKETLINKSNPNEV